MKITINLTRKQDGSLSALLEHDQQQIVVEGSRPEIGISDEDQENIERCEWDAFLTYCAALIVRRIRIKEGKPVSTWATDEIGRASYTGMSVVGDKT